MLDHELFKEIGEELPVYKPPLNLKPFEEHEREPETVKNSVKVKARYLTPTVNGISTPLSLTTLECSPSSGVDNTSGLATKTPKKRV
jgi:hypothetical protein